MALVAGHGFGKTVFAASAPNALFALSDKEGAESARNLGVGLDSDEWPIRSWEELDELYEYMVNDGCDEYTWLVHDNATVENKYAMRAAMALPKGAHNDYIPAQQSYQYSQNAFLQMVDRFTDLPINQIWIVRPRLISVDDPDTGSMDIYTADIQNDGIAENFLGMMKIVGMGKPVEPQDDEDSDDEPARRLFFKHRGPYRGKDRTTALGVYQDDLTVPRMMELIEARRRKAARKVTGGSRPAAKKTAVRRRRTA